MWSSSKASGYIEKVMASGITILDLDSEIINNALNSTEKYRVHRYGIYDHLIAWTMKHHTIRSIVTANKNDFEKYEFITDIIAPEKNTTSSQVNKNNFL